MRTRGRRWLRETQALELADAEEVDFLKAFQAQQNVEYYDMIKMDGLEGDAVATATYDILKAYVISSEHSVGGKDNAYSKVRYANSGKYPDHREQLVPFLAARIQDLEKKMQDVPVYDSPWINGNSTFKKPKMPVVDEIQKFYTAETISGFHDVTTRLNYTLAEFNRKVIERKDYAYLTCNIAERSDIYRGRARTQQLLLDQSGGIPGKTARPFGSRSRDTRECVIICVCVAGGLARITTATKIPVKSARVRRAKTRACLIPWST